MPPLRLVERHRFLDSYGFVLVLIVTTYVTAVTLTEPWGATIVLVVQIAAVTVTLHVSHARRLVRVVAIVALVLSGIAAVANLVDPTDDSLLPVLFACSTLLYVVAPFSIVRHVAQRQRIDVETFLGALAAYLLLGIAFAFSYRFIGEVQDTPFFGDAGDGTIADVLFFSFITLTTTGYGNLVPAENPGQSLAVLEALLGQLFLVTAVAKIVSAWQPRRREADRHRGMTQRIGFHGAGFITRAHRWLLEHAGVSYELVAVHDPDAARAARFAEQTGAAAVSEHAIVELADVVFVCTWTSEHPRLVADAAAAGRAVFCEKPLAVDAAHVEQMIADVEQAGVVNQVGLILRFLPGYVMVRHLLDDERAGHVMTVNLSDDQYLPVQGQYASTWRADPARAGRGALLEHSIHDVDILHWTFGPVRSVSTVARQHHGLPRIDDATVARLEFESGAVGTLTTVWHDLLERPNMRRLEVICERLYVVLEGDSDGVLRWRFAGEDENTMSGVELADAARSAGGDAAGPLVPFGAGHGFNPLTRFLEAARDGAPSPLPFTEAAAAHHLVDAMYRSADHGGTVIEAGEP